MRLFTKVVIAGLLCARTFAEAPAAPAANAKPAANAGSLLSKAPQPDLAQADPSLLLDIPDPKPAKPVVKPKPAPQVQKPEGGTTMPAMGSINKVIRFDKPIDKNLSLPVGAEVSVILANNKFFPSKIKLREGLSTRLVFTTVNKRPGALVMESLQVQRWIAKERPPGESEADRARWESSHEINANHVTEIILQEPKLGKYLFHDALTGATGEITVE